MTDRMPAMHESPPGMSFRTCGDGTRRAGMTAAISRRSKGMSVGTQRRGRRECRAVRRRVCSEMMIETQRAENGTHAAMEEGDAPVHDRNATMRDSNLAR